MKKSLADIKELLKEIANNHANINSYFFGSYVEAVSRDALTYPAMIPTVQPSTLSFKKANINMDVYFVDKYKESDYEMRDDVLSDLLLIATDVRALMRKEIYDDFEINQNITLNPFVNYGGDLTCGWVMSIDFEIDDLMNYCAVPNK